MWWNILPSWIITGGCMYVPIVFTCGAAYWYTGCISGRGITSQENYYHIFRDKRVLGGADPFRENKHLGLDGIPDN